MRALFIHFNLVTVFPFSNLPLLKTCRLRNDTNAAGHVDIYQQTQFRFCPAICAKYPRRCIGFPALSVPSPASTTNFRWCAVAAAPSLYGKWSMESLHGEPGASITASKRTLPPLVSTAVAMAVPLVFLTSRLNTLNTARPFYF